MAQRLTANVELRGTQPKGSFEKRWHHKKIKRALRLRNPSTCMLPQRYQPQNRSHKLSPRNQNDTPQGGQSHPDLARHQRQAGGQPPQRSLRQPRSSRTRRRHENGRHKQHPAQTKRNYRWCARHRGSEEPFIIHYSAASTRYNLLVESQQLAKPSY
jgi:hypothetical protein